MNPVFIVNFNFDLLVDMQILAGRRNQCLLQGIEDNGVIHILGLDNSLERIEQFNLGFVLFSHF